jgi:hypothetical protein
LFKWREGKEIEQKEKNCDLERIHLWKRESSKPRVLVVKRI